MTRLAGSIPRTGRSRLSQPGLRDEFWAAVRTECQRLSADGHLPELAFPPGASPAAPQQSSPVMPVTLPLTGLAAQGERQAGQDWVVPDPDPDNLARNGARRIGPRPGPGTAPRAPPADRRGRGTRDPHLGTVVRGREPAASAPWPPAQQVGRPVRLARPARRPGRAARRRHRPRGHRAVRGGHGEHQGHGHGGLGGRIRPDRRREVRRLPAEVTQRGIPRRAAAEPRHRPGGAGAAGHRVRRGPPGQGRRGGPPDVAVLAEPPQCFSAGCSPSRLR